MLIIFDLDDTLIDTSGSVTPFKLRAFLKKLDLLHKEEELFRLNEECLRSKEAINHFLSPYSFDSHILSLAFQELTTPLPSDFHIPTTPHAKEILSFYRHSCPLVLVTGGNSRFQKEKMEKAGIDAAFFSKIEIPEDSVKKPIYQALLQEFSCSPDQAWVCGDRIAMDLLPAQELGMRTIHMRWGRGKRQRGETPEYAISDLTELKEIIR